MGLGSWIRGRRMSDPVIGTFELTGCSAPARSAMYANCELIGVVTGPGIEATAVRLSCVAPTARWPTRGQRLPVTVDRADPGRLAVRWQEVPDNRDRALRQARRQVASVTAPPPGPPVLAEPLPADPLPGIARVLAVHEIPVPRDMTMPPGHGGVVNLTLDITPPDGPAYSTITRIGFTTPARRERIAVVGADLPVLIDPAAPDQITIDITRIDW